MKTVPDTIGVQFQESSQRLASEHLRDLSGLTRTLLDTPRIIADLCVDLSRQLLDDQALKELLQLAARMGFDSRRQTLWREMPGQKTASDAPLYMALRAPATDNSWPDADQTQQTLTEMFGLAERLIQGDWAGSTGKPIRDLVHLGIGGSHLGPELVCRALRAQGLQRIRVHYVANVDGVALKDVLAEVHPEQTLFFVASKSFTTKEVLVNMGSARSWLLERGISLSGLSQHFLATTAHPERAHALGILPEHCLRLTDWTVGRFSIWSGVGLSLAVHLGVAGFREFLAGARLVDEHFYTMPMADNLPLLLALVDLWNSNVLELASQVILPYTQRLVLLPAYLQQLQMESSGKRVSRNGQVLSHRTSPVLWGGVGTNGQHAYHQLLHQGTESFAADFILCLDGQSGFKHHQDWLVSACLGQAEAFARGEGAFVPQTEEEAVLPPAAHKALPGNKPSTMILLSSLTPSSMGQLLALFEHRIFCQSILWDINAFDQFGVEHGKRLANHIYTAITQHEETGEETTDRLLSLYRQRLVTPK